MTDLYVRKSTATTLDEWIAKLRKCEHLTESEHTQLCNLVKPILMEESNVQPVTSPVVVCGDIHGQFYDLLRIFEIGGEIPQARYVFMGDFVDRGHHSVETLQLLLCYKARYPDCVTLLRGNHESRGVAQVHGFYDEVFRKYSSVNVWRASVDVFDHMPLACVIDGSIFCVHAGLSPEICTLDEIRSLDRFREIPHEGGFCDLMWSDPEEDQKAEWGVSMRGAGFLFNGAVAKRWCRDNGLELICRAHQLVNEGYKYYFSDKNLVTVWSAPNYCYRCGNEASVLLFDEHCDREVRVFKESASSGDMSLSKGGPFYFL